MYLKSGSFRDVNRHKIIQLFSLKTILCLVCFPLLGVAALVGSLFMFSPSMTRVLAPQGYETYALATPTTIYRSVREHQVSTFAGKLNIAFGIDEALAAEFTDWIIEASERQQIAPELLASLVLTESSFRKSARSHIGAVGPAQIRPDYWRSFCGAENLLDPEQNIYCGAQILSHLLERCKGDQTCALAAYNVGPYANRVNAAQRYVSKVGRHLTSLQAASL